MSRQDGGSVVSRIPAALVVLGVLLLAAHTIELVLVVAFDAPIDLGEIFYVGMGSSAPFAAGIVAGGYWLDRSDLGTCRYPRIAGWCAVGLVSFLLLNVVVIATFPDLTLATVFGWVRWAVSIGAAVGLLMGVIEGRSIERALTAEREALRSDHLERRRDTLDYLNSVLRHEVLNAATVIDGYASNLVEECEGERQRWAEIVRSEAAEMTGVIDDVRVLLHETDGSVSLHPVDVTDVLADEVRKLRHTHPQAEVDLDAPETAPVLADHLLPRVFGNVLFNAVEHHDAPDPHVEVTVRTDEETVRVAVVDDGPGVPDAKLETLFERTESRDDSHGLGLYLVAHLVDRYDGRVDLAETGPGGSRFVIEFPLAAAADGDSGADQGRPIESPA